MNRNKKEQVIDLLKDFLSWITVTAVAFVWWLSVLLIFSLILLSVWKTSFEAIVWYSLIMMSVTSLIYLARIVYKRIKIKKV